MSTRIDQSSNTNAYNTLSSSQAVGGHLATINPIDVTTDPVTSQQILNIGQLIINSTQIVSSPSISLAPPSDLYSAPRISTYSAAPSGPVGAQEWINIGAQPNDGEGDPLRTAFNKINNNFANLFLTTTTTSSTYTEGLTPNQVIFEYPADQFTQAMFQVRSSDPGGADSQDIVISAQITNNQADVKCTGYGLTFAGNAVCSYDMDVLDGNVRLLATPIIDTYALHFIASTVTYIGNAEPGLDIGLDGYTNDLLGTESELIITTETP